MAKLGRYSADRKKVVLLTNAASTTGEVGDCGTVFTASGASGTTTYVLPAIADAGKGWWIKVIKVGAAGAGGAININAHADDGDNAVKGVEASQTCEAHDGDDIAIANGADPGAQVEVICDGTRWLSLSHAVDAGDIQIG